MGSALRQVSKPTEALGEYGVAIALSPGQSRTYFNRGGTYLELERYDQALADFAQVLRLYPHHRPALFWAGYAYLQKGKSDSAAICLSAMLDRPVGADRVGVVVDSLKSRSDAAAAATGGNPRPAQRTLSPQPVEHGR
jgi:tetratricopeptide (TPR) repeat protein